MEPFIVAEVSKNWKGGEACASTGPLCFQFENVINANYLRGYILHSFVIHRAFLPPDAMNETLVAVFRRKDIPTE